MPPRGRGRRKSGQMRADAAMDAMRAFGFRVRMISETLKELLQVYGEDGWIFIEDSSYKVLLDAILEKVKKEEEEKEAAKGEMDGNSVQHNGEVDQDVCSKQVTETGTQTDQTDAASVTDEMTLYSPAHYSGGGGGTKENNEGSTHIRRAKPCYGWISSEEEDEEDYVVKLTPQPLSENLKKLLLASNEQTKRKRKRKTRWDMSREELSTQRELQFT